MRIDLSGTLIEMARADSHWFDSFDPMYYIVIHWANQVEIMRIDGLSWDERAEDHIAAHSVRLYEVEQAVVNHIHARRAGTISSS